MQKVVGYRNMLGMNQQEMADHLGISKQAYWNKENKKTPFTDDEKVIIKDLLKPLFPNIKIDDIFF